MMILWLLVGIGVTVISALSVVAVVYLAITGWLHKWMGGEDT